MLKEPRLLLLPFLHLWLRDDLYSTTSLKKVWATHLHCSHNQEQLNPSEKKQRLCTTRRRGCWLTLSRYRSFGFKDFHQKSVLLTDIAASTGLGQSCSMESWSWAHRSCSHSPGGQGTRPGRWLPPSVYTAVWAMAATCLLLLSDQTEWREAQTTLDSNHWAS